MCIKIKLSNNLINDYNERQNMKTVDAITHILKSDNSIKSDFNKLSEIALKDLYVIVNSIKYFCTYAYVDTTLNNIELYF